MTIYTLQHTMYSNVEAIMGKKSSQLLKIIKMAHILITNNESD